MVRLFQSKGLRLFLVIQLLLVSLGWSQKSIDNSPCNMAVYDAEHNNQRTYDMLVAMYEGDLEKIEKYVSCYTALTGVEITPKEPDVLTTKEKIVIVALVLLVVGGIVYSDAPIFPSPEFGSSGNGAFVGM